MHPRVDPSAPSHAERALSFYAAAISHSPIPSYVGATRNRMAAWNEPAEQLPGFTANALVGHACYRSPLDQHDSTGQRLCVALMEAMAECPVGVTA